jgi:hypothetical protein
MNRKSDVDTILIAVLQQHEAVKQGYDKALQDHSLDLRVPVKNLMENLRSALDYMAHDIYEACCRGSRADAGVSAPKNIYFPYGRTEQDFKSAIGKYLPRLEAYNRTVYNLVLSIQPFSSGDNWLHDLCSILNEKKHDKLTPQVRSESETYTVESTQGSVTIPINNPNVKITSRPGAVRIFGVPAQFTERGIETAPSGGLTHRRTKWIAFTFGGTDINVLSLLDKSIKGIRQLAEELYHEI